MSTDHHDRYHRNMLSILSTRQSLVVLNATNDDDSKKTWNRLLAEYLMKYRWYFPKRELGPSLEEAWCYYEHITLPRYLVGEIDKPMAEAGESKETELYPYSTPHKYLYEWGIGTAMYFTSIRAMSIILFVAGLINIPNIIFYSYEYTTDKQSGLSDIMYNLGILLRGSVVCTDTKWYPCYGKEVCSPESWIRSGRFVNATEVEELYFMERNECEGAQFNQGIYNWATLVFIIICYIFYRFYHRYAEQQSEEAGLTVADYTIEVVNPPPNATDPEKWRDYFSQFAEKHVVACTRSLKNSDLIHALVARRELLKHISKRYPNIDFFDRETLEQFINTIKKKEQKKKSCFFNFCLDDKLLVRKLCKLEGKIKEMHLRKYEVDGVYVTFETEEGQRTALAALSVGTVDIWLNNQNAVAPTALFHNRVLNVRRPVEPSCVLWKFAGVSSHIKFLQRGLTSLIMIITIILIAFIVTLLNKEDLVFGSALIITTANISIPYFAKALVDYFEAHSTEGGRQVYVFLKIFLFRIVNTSILYLALTSNTNYITIKEDDLLPKIMAIFVSELFISPLLRVTDVWGNFQKHFLAPRAKTQWEMNLYFRGMPVSLAERFTEYAKVNYLCFFYGALIPGAFFISASTHLLNYATDKFCLLRVYARTSEIGTQLPNFHLKYVFSTSILVFALMSSWHYASFPFDNVCVSDKNETSIYSGKYNVTFLHNGTSWILEIEKETEDAFYCNQDAISFVKTRFQNIFPAIPDIQTEGVWMTTEQEKLTTLYGWTSVFVLIMYIIGVFGVSIRTAFLSLFHGVHLTEKVNANKDFSNLEGEDGYVPEINEFSFGFPLIACDIDDIDHGLLGWQDPNHSYDYHNLLFDVPYAGMRRRVRRTCDEEQNDEESDVSCRPLVPNFSTIKHWPPG